MCGLIWIISFEDPALNTQAQKWLVLPWSCNENLAEKLHYTKWKLTSYKKHQHHVQKTLHKLPFYLKIFAAWSICIGYKHRCPLEHLDMWLLGTKLSSSLEFSATRLSDKVYLWYIVSRSEVRGQLRAENNEVLTMFHNRGWWIHISAWLLCWWWVWI